MIWTRAGSITVGDDPPPRRQALRNVAPGVKEMVARSRRVSTFNGTPTDSGWEAWDSFFRFAFVLYGYAIDDPSIPQTKTSTEYIEMAAGIGRPWKLVWSDKITTLIGGAVTYEVREQILVPGGVYEIAYTADSGTERKYHEAMILIPADGA